MKNAVLSNWQKALLLLAIAVAVSFVLAFASDAYAFGRGIPTPGLMMWTLLNPIPPEGYLSYVGPSLAVDTVCWLVVVVGIHSLIRTLRRRFGSPD